MSAHDRHGKPAGWSRRNQRRRQRLALEALEPRIVLSGPQSVDLGDLYFYQGQAQKLLRANDRLVVRFDAPAMSQTVAALTAADGPLAGARVEATGDRQVLAFTLAEPLERPDLEALRQSLSTTAGVEYATETFVAPTGGERLFATNEVLVALRPGVQPADVFTPDRFSGYRPLGGTTDQFVASARTEPGPATVGFAASIYNDPRVAWTTPNFAVNLQKFAAPNDPRFGDQWHLTNTGQNGGTPGADARLQGAWDLGYTGAGITIAIVDDSVQLNHPDLVPNLWTNPGEVPGDGIDNDGNGWVDDVNGWDFGDYDNNPSPALAEDNHGTAVAGVAAAAGNNNLGVAGAAYNARIMAVRLLSPNLTIDHWAEAIYYISGRTRDGSGTWKSADVANHSYGTTQAFDVIQTAFTWSSTQGRDGKGTVNFVAMGNSATRTDPGPDSYPAKHSGVIGVGGTTERDVRVEYAQYGSHLWIVAPTGSAGYVDANGTPGIQNITTTDRTGSDGYAGGDYTNGFNGTSSASPLAAGVGAVLLSVNPNLTYEQVRQTLRDTADKVGGVTYDANGFNLQYGYGRINAVAAVRQHAVQVSVAPAPYLTENFTYSNVVVGAVQFPNVPANLASYSAEFVPGDGRPALPATLVDRGGGFYEVVVPSLFYQDGGRFDATVRLLFNGALLKAATGLFPVWDRPLNGTGVTLFLDEGQLFSGVVGSFTDTDPDLTSTADYSVSILWGDDGSTSPGILTPVPGQRNTYTVSGSHVFGAVRVPITVSIMTRGGNQEDVWSMALVTDSPLTASFLPGVPSPTEGMPYTAPLVRFRDADPRTQPASHYAATIDWGDGSAPTAGVITPDLDNPGSFLVAGSHVYDVSPGGVPYPVTVAISNRISSDGQSVLSDPVKVGGQLSVIDSPITAEPLSFNAVEGVRFSAFLGTFDDPDPRVIPQRYIVTMQWGDGTTGSTEGEAPDLTVVVNTDGGYLLRGRHAYRHPGTYTYTATIADRVGGASTTTTGVITVSAAAMAATIVPDLQATEGQILTVPVAAFSTANTLAQPSDFSARLVFGDGTSTEATSITFDPIGQQFLVSAGKAYSQPGIYPVSVVVTRVPGGQEVQAEGTIEVLDAPLEGQTGSLTGLVSKTPYTDLAVASFRDLDPESVLSDFTAAITWGDGSRSAGRISRNPDGSYAVRGDHGFSRSGTYNGSVEVVSAGGSRATIPVTLAVTPKPYPISGSVAQAGVGGAGYTNQASPGFRGQAEPGSTVSVFARTHAGGALIPLGTAQAGANGAWSTPSGGPALTDGTYQIFASSIGVDGDISSPMTVIQPNPTTGALVVDTQGPKVSQLTVLPGSGEIRVTLTDSLSGLWKAGLDNPANYKLAISGPGINRSLPVSRLTVNPATPNTQQTATLIFGGVSRLQRGTYVIQLASKGLTDLAGNPLDESYFLPFPGLNTRSGQDYVAQFRSDGTTASALMPYIPPPEVSAARRYNQFIGARLRRRF